MSFNSEIVSKINTRNEYLYVKLKKIYFIQLCMITISDSNKNYEYKNTVKFY